jgi:hypothetical protein
MAKKQAAGHHVGTRHARHKTKPRPNLPPAVRWELKAREEADDIEAREELNQWPAKKKHL